MPWHPCLLREIWNITVRRTTWTHVVSQCTWTWRRVVWFWVDKPRKKAEERKWKQLIKLSGLLYDACFNGTLDYEVVMVDTSLNAFLFARCILALINFELARTIASCLVCFTCNDMKWNEHRRYPFLLESIFISAWPVFDLISTKDFYSSFSRSVLAHCLS